MNDSAGMAVGKVKIRSEMDQMVAEVYLEIKCMGISKISMSNDFHNKAS